jgi:Uma2 family endonuclease
MPQPVEQPGDGVPSPLRIRWTRADCHALVAHGDLAPGGYELIEGDILRSAGWPSSHGAAVSRLAAWCRTVFGDDFVETHAPIDVAPEDNRTSEPEPDVYILRCSSAHFPDGVPSPSDLRLVAEVADVTLAFDLSTKASLYARAGIPEYWVLDIGGRALIVHHSPDAGRYRSVVRFAAHEAVTPRWRPGVSITAAALLPGTALMPGA